MDEFHGITQDGSKISNIYPQGICLGCEGPANFYVRGEGESTLAFHSQFTIPFVPILIGSGYAIFNQNAEYFALGVVVSLPTFLFGTPLGRFIGRIGDAIRNEVFFTKEELAIRQAKWNKKLELLLELSQDIKPSPARFF